MLSFRQHAARPIYITLAGLEHKSNASIIAKRKTSTTVYGYTGSNFPELLEYDTFIHILDEPEFRKLNKSETEVPVGDSTNDTYFLKSKGLNLPKKSVLYIVLSKSNYDRAMKDKKYPNDRVFKQIMANIKDTGIDKVLPISIWKEKEKKKGIFGKIIMIAGASIILSSIFGGKKGKRK